MLRNQLLIGDIIIAIEGQGGAFQALCAGAADRGLRPPPAALPPANAQRAFQARRGDGFQREVSGSWRAA